MLTWAIAWMAVQMARVGREIDGLTALLFCSVVADIALLGLGLSVVDKACGG